jgi:hypothetical protein
VSNGRATRRNAKVGKIDAKGGAVVKDYCVVCGTALYGYMKIGAKVPEPRCSDHRRHAGRAAS